jgi:hypothetical protein
LAVGSDAGDYAFDGSAWTATPSGVPAQSVSCEGTIEAGVYCKAVGSGSTAGTFTTCAAPGCAGWTVDHDVAAAGFDPAAVACTGPEVCEAVGRSEASGLDGNWQPGVTVGDPFEGGHPTAVSCTSASFCMLVNSVGSVLRYDGASWTAPEQVVVRNNPSQTVFTSVSCVSASFCLAIDAGTLCFPASGCPAQAWLFDGRSWTATAAPTEDHNVSLTSVSCASGVFCAAVNGYGEESTYDGTSFSTLSPIDTGTGGRHLISISCPTDRFCAAVDQSSGDVVTFNGSSWSAPADIDGGAAFAGVSCTSSSFCVAVDFSNGDAFMFNGSVWSQPTLIDSAGGGMTTVSCASSTFCVAGDEDGNVVSWDGRNWSEPASVDPAGGGFVSVSCGSPSFCVAVDSIGRIVTYTGPPASTPTGNGGKGSAKCMVPRLKHLTLPAARKALAKAHCSLGMSKKPHHKQRGKPGRHKTWKLLVAGQSPAAGKREPTGSAVSVTLRWVAVKR